MHTPCMHATSPVEPIFRERTFGIHTYIDIPTRYKGIHMYIYVYVHAGDRILTVSSKIESCEIILGIREVVRRTGIEEVESCLDILLHIVTTEKMQIPQTIQCCMHTHTDAYTHIHIHTYRYTGIYTYIDTARERERAMHVKDLYVAEEKREREKVEQIDRLKIGG